jgi:transposase
MLSYASILGLSGLEIESVEIRDRCLEIRACTQQMSVPCPACGRSSHRVHSYYTRHPADLPVGHQRTRFFLSVRRFRCMNPQCARATFSEPAPNFLSRYSRRSRRLTAALEAVAYALGGEGGSRLAHRLQMPSSGDTLLRLIRQAPPPSVDMPRVIGVDDWAKQRGQVYGTIIVDLERRRTIDLLGDRQAETLIAWLRQQPQVQVMARDRSAEYRKAAEIAVPQCQQVADRWHLLKNLRDMLEHLVAQHRAALKPTRPEVLATAPLEPQSGPIPQLRLSDHLRYGAAARQERSQQRGQLFREMQQGLARGATPVEIARQLAIAPNTVRAYLARGGPPAEVSPRPSRPKRIDPYLAHLTQRWHAGCRNASRLWREITELGFHGPRSLVARWVRERREQPAATTPPRFRAVFNSSADEPSAGQSTPPVPAAPPASRQLAWLLLQAPEDLKPGERIQLEQLRQLEPLRISYELAQDFLKLVRTRAVADLEPWLQRARQTRLRKWQQFAQGLRQDLDAVRAAITSNWSNGQTEGQVNKLKLYKRQMYGRAKLDLLRARMLRPP